jgi:hypothetical protein
MKHAALIPALLLAFAFPANAQEEKQVTQRQPPIITVSKVEQDEAMARELRLKNSNKKEPEREEKAMKTEDAALTSNTKNASSKKTSKQPGEQ